MELNQGPLNDYALNDPGPQTVFADWAQEASLVELSSHQRIHADWAMEAGPFIGSTPVQTVVSTWAIEGAPHHLVTSQSVFADWAMEGTPQLLTLLSQTVLAEWAMESSGQQIIPTIFGTEFGIAPSVALDVIGQTGSAIYSKWQQRSIKEVRLNRHADRHEQSAADEEATRHAWDLEVQLSGSQIAAHWTFIKDHFGLGKPFYFYDLQNNGFQYDPTGASTDGRYLVRFAEESFPRIQKEGLRFILNYTLIEVE